jgi:bifunctional UDP-N-acetylglucosamine pyrophosphorylase/glucosamine-1-phosphate N-acetyltransferase
MSHQKITSIILAAGKGTRMKSAKAKVLHEVFFRPMIHHVLDAAIGAGIKKHAVIIGHQRNRVNKTLVSYEVATVVQEEQLGTGHAVLCAESACTDSDTIMILCGDTPLIRPETLSDMLQQHKKQSAAITLMTTTLDNPFGYGRIITGEKNLVTAIVEEKDATPEQRAISEINAGIYVTSSEYLFSTLKQVGNDNSQGEVYLTDIVTIANKQGAGVHKFVHPNAIDVLGVNSRVELALAHHELQMRRNQELMMSGVTIYCPETVFIAPKVVIGQDTIIHPGVQITGNSKIGSECEIESYSKLHECTAGKQVIIRSQSYLQACTIGDCEHVAPRTLRYE